MSFDKPLNIHDDRFYMNAILREFGGMPGVVDPTDFNLSQCDPEEEGSTGTRGADGGGLPEADRRREIDNKITIATTTSLSSTPRTTASPSSSSLSTALYSSSIASSSFSSASSSTGTDPLLLLEIKREVEKEGAKFEGFFALSASIGSLVERTIKVVRPAEAGKFLSLLHTADNAFRKAKELGETEAETKLRRRVLDAPEVVTIRLSRCQKLIEFLQPLFNQYKLIIEKHLSYLTIEQIVHFSRVIVILQLLKRNSLKNAINPTIDKNLTFIIHRISVGNSYEIPEKIQDEQQMVEQSFVALAKQMEDHFNEIAFLNILADIEMEYSLNSFYSRPLSPAKLDEREAIIAHTQVTNLLNDFCMAIFPLIERKISHTKLLITKALTKQNIPVTDRTRLEKLIISKRIELNDHLGTIENALALIKIKVANRKLYAQEDLKTLITIFDRLDSFFKEVENGVKAPISKIKAKKPGDIMGMLSTLMQDFQKMGDDMLDKDDQDELAMPRIFSPATPTTTIGIEALTSNLTLARDSMRQVRYIFKVFLQISRNRIPIEEVPSTSLSLTPTSTPTATPKKTKKIKKKKATSKTKEVAARALSLAPKHTSSSSSSSSSSSPIIVDPTIPRTQFLSWLSYELAIANGVKMSSLPLNGLGSLISPAIATREEVCRSGQITALRQLEIGLEMLFDQRAYLEGAPLPFAGPLHQYVTLLLFLSIQEGLTAKVLSENPTGYRSHDISVILEQLDKIPEGPLKEVVKKLNNLTTVYRYGDDGVHPNKGQIESWTKLMKQMLPLFLASCDAESGKRIEKRLEAYLKEFDRPMAITTSTINAEVSDAQLKRLRVAEGTLKDAIVRLSAFIELSIKSEEEDYKSIKILKALLRQLKIIEAVPYTITMYPHQRQLVISAGMLFISGKQVVELAGIRAAWVQGVADIREAHPKTHHDLRGVHCDIYKLDDGLGEGVVKLIDDLNVGKGFEVPHAICATRARVTESMELMNELMKRAFASGDTLRTWMVSSETDEKRALEAVDGLRERVVTYTERIASLSSTLVASLTAEI